MKKQAESGELICVNDFGDATTETKQQSPAPYYADTLYGMGFKPG